jgi:predicted secreted Zn-dependent protease
MAFNVAPTTLVHFEVSAKDLLGVVKALGLDKEEKEVGRCSYNVTHEYDSVSRKGFPVGLDVDVTITIRMPEWKERSTAKKAEGKEWDRFYRVLMVHERGHESRTKAAAKKLYYRLRKTKVKDLDKRYDDGMKRIKEINDSYDTATKGGLKPPPGTKITIP